MKKNLIYNSDRRVRHQAKATKSERRKIILTWIKLQQKTGAEKACQNKQVLWRLVGNISQVNKRGSGR